MHKQCVGRSRFTERACRVPPQGAAGALFSVVPFVSKRSLGLVCGFVGAGGNTGSAITQVRVPTRHRIVIGSKGNALRLCFQY